MEIYWKIFYIYKSIDLSWGCGTHKEGKDLSVLLRTIYCTWLSLPSPFPNFNSLVRAANRKLCINIEHGVQK